MPIWQNCSRGLRGPSPKSTCTWAPSYPGHVHNMALSCLVNITGLRTCLGSLTLLCTCQARRIFHVWPIPVSPPHISRMPRSLADYNAHLRGANTEHRVYTDREPMLKVWMSTASFWLLHTMLHPVFNLDNKCTKILKTRKSMCFDAPLIFKNNMDLGIFAFRSSRFTAVINKNYFILRIKAFPSYQSQPKI